MSGKRGTSPPRTSTLTLQGGLQQSWFWGVYRVDCGVQTLAQVGFGPEVSVTVTGTALVTVAGQSELGMESSSLVVIGQARGFTLFISDIHFM